MTILGRVLFFLSGVLWILAVLFSSCLVLFVVLLMSFVDFFLHCAHLDRKEKRAGCFTFCLLVCVNGCAVRCRFSRFLFMSVM